MTSDKDVTESVKVAVRCRPLNSRELSLNSSIAVNVVKGEQIILQSLNSSTTREDKAFTFDHNYGIDSTQECVFKDIGVPIVKKCLGGFNATIFACEKISILYFEKLFSIF